MGKYYEVKEGNKVSFSITAPRSVLDKLDESDFVAEANLQKLQMDDEGTTGTIPIEIICTNTNASSVKITSTSKDLLVALEDLMMKKLVSLLKAEKLQFMILLKPLNIQLQSKSRFI